MALSMEEQNRLIEGILTKTGCPVKCIDRLDAYREGVLTAVRCVAPHVSMPEPGRKAESNGNVVQAGQE